MQMLLQLLQLLWQPQMQMRNACGGLRDEAETTTKCRKSTA